MSAPYVDTDVLIRLLTGDDPAKQAAARTLFTAVEEGRLTVAAPESVIADAVFVLSSPRRYRLPRPRITTLLGSLVRLPHFRVHNRPIVARALDLYGSTGLGFGDALLVATLERQGGGALFSYDAHFDRFAAIERREP